MAINKAVLAAMKAVSRVSPDIRSSYKAIRVAEDVSSGMGIPDPRCKVEETAVAARDGYEIPCRVFTPREFEFSLKEGLQVTEDFRGTILFFHGGGWANGDVDFYSDACAATAIRLERRVVAVDYRRAPEHRFPQAVEDCYEVAHRLHAGELLPDVRRDRIVLFGDSAGGNLAAAVSLMARDRGEFAVRTQMLLYPALGNDHDPETSPFDSVRENGEGYLLTSRDIRGYMELYASGPGDRENPYFAPLAARDLSRQPRTLVMTADHCPLRDEGECYARRLDEAGTEVACYRLLDAVHGFFVHGSVPGPLKDTYRIMGHFLDGDGLVAGEGEPTWREIPGIA